MVIEAAHPQHKEHHPYGYVLLFKNDLFCQKTDGSLHIIHRNDLQFFEYLRSNIGIRVHVALIEELEVQTFRRFTAPGSHIYSQNFSSLPWEQFQVAVPNTFEPSHERARYIELDDKGIEEISVLQVAAVPSFPCSDQVSSRTSWHPFTGVRFTGVLAHPLAEPIDGSPIVI